MHICFMYLFILLNDTSWDYKIVFYSQITRVNDTKIFVVLCEFDILLIVVNKMLAIMQLTYFTAGFGPMTNDQTHYFTFWNSSFIFYGCLPLEWRCISFKFRSTKCNKWTIFSLNESKFMSILWIECDEIDELGSNTRVL